MTSRLDEILASGVARGAAPGVVAVVVDRDSVRYEGAFGERSLGSGHAMTADTVGAIFSMTKAVTAAAAMQLVERGRLSLDAPASDVCPELGACAVLTGFDESGRPELRPAASSTTLRQLLTHTSGFGYDIWNADLMRWHEVTGVPTMGSDGRAALAAPLLFDPGTRWQYGIGLDWVGVMIETASGTTLGEFIAENLTGPLGMVDTAFVPTALDVGTTECDAHPATGRLAHAPRPPGARAWRLRVGWRRSPRHHGRLRPVHPDDAG